MLAPRKTRAAEEAEPQLVNKAEEAGTTGDKWQEWASLTQGHPQCYDQGYRETASCEEEWAAELARSKRPG